MTSFFSSKRAFEMGLGLVIGAVVLLLSAAVVTYGTLNTGKTLDQYTKCEGHGGFISDSVCISACDGDIAVRDPTFSTESLDGKYCCIGKPGNQAAFEECLDQHRVTGGARQGVLEGKDMSGKSTGLYIEVNSEEVLTAGTVGGGNQQKVIDYFTDAPIAIEAVNYFDEEATYCYLKVFDKENLRQIAFVDSSDCAPQGSQAKVIALETRMANEGRYKIDFVLRNEKESPNVASAAAQLSLTDFDLDLRIPNKIYFSTARKPLGNEIHCSFSPLFVPGGVANTFVVNGVQVLEAEQCPTIIDATITGKIPIKLGNKLCAHAEMRDGEGTTYTWNGQIDRKGADACDSVQFYSNYHLENLCFCNSHEGATACLDASEDCGTPACQWDSPAFGGNSCKACDYDDSLVACNDYNDEISCDDNPCLLNSKCYWKFNMFGSNCRSCPEVNSCAELEDEDSCATCQPNSCEWTNNACALKIS